MYLDSGTQAARKPKHFAGISLPEWDSSYGADVGYRLGFGPLLGGPIGAHHGDTERIMTTILLLMMMMMMPTMIIIMFPPNGKSQRVSRHKRLATANILMYPWVSFVS